MASSRAVRAGRAFVEIFARDRLTGQLKNIQARLNRFGSALQSVGTRLAGIGGAAAAGFGAAASLFTEAGSELARLSAQTGASVEALSRLKSAAVQSGASFDGVEGALEELNIRLGETIREGTGPAAEAFKTLGLDARRLAKMSPVDRFRAIAEALSDIQSESKRGFLADEIFGGDAFKILPLLRQGADGIDRLMRQARVLTEEDVEAAEALRKAWRTLTGQATHLAVQIGAAVAPALQSTFEGIQPILSAAIRWIKNNRELVATIAKVTAAVTVAGLVIAGLGTAVVAAGVVFGSLATIVSTVGAALGALLSPIGLVVAAIAGIGVVLLTQTSLGAKALDVLREKFGPLLQTAREVFGGIKDALAAGEFKLAAQIVWSSLQLAWLQGKDRLLDIWESGMTSMRKAWTNTVFAISKMFTVIIGAASQAAAKAAGAVFNVITSLKEELGLISELEADMARTLAQIGTGGAAGQAKQEMEQQIANLEERRKKAIEEINKAEAAGDRERAAAIRRQKEELDGLIEKAREAREQSQKTEQKPVSAPVPENVGEQTERMARGANLARNVAGSLSSREGIGAVLDVLRGGAVRSVEDKQLKTLVSIDDRSKKQEKHLHEIARASRGGLAIASVSSS